MGNYHDVLLPCVFSRQVKTPRRFRIDGVRVEGRVLLF